MPKSTPVIINNIQLRSADRGRKDIADWKSAVQSATSVHYERRTRLYDLYTNILQDAFLKSLVERRTLTVTNTRLKFVHKDQENEELYKLANTPAFKKALKEILLAKLWGYSVIQVVYNNGKLTVYSVPRKHIRPKKGEIVKEQSEENGFSYRKPPYTNYVFECGETEDLGLLLEACPLVIYKRGTLGDWAQFSELFGQPIRKATYDQHDPSTKAEAANMLDQAGGSLSMLLPKGVDLELVENAHQSGGGALYQNFIKQMNDELSILLLGNTETTSSSKSSGYAQAKEHRKSEEEIVRDDRDYVLSILNECMLPILRAQGITAEGEFEWELDSTISVKDKLDMDLKVKKAGIPIADEHFYETYDIPKPDNYKDLKAEKGAKKESQKESPSAEDGEDKKKPAQKKSAKKKKLSSWNKFLISLSDFFYPAQ